jgi:hypothetical protein
MRKGRIKGNGSSFSDLLHVTNNLQQERGMGAPLSDLLHVTKMMKQECGRGA